MGLLFQLETQPLESPSFPVNTHIMTNLAPRDRVPENEELGEPLDATRDVSRRFIQDIDIGGGLLEFLVPGSDVKLINGAGSIPGESSGVFSAPQASLSSPDE